VGVPGHSQPVAGLHHADLAAHAPSVPAAELVARALLERHGALAEPTLGVLDDEPPRRVALERQRLPHAHLEAGVGRLAEDALAAGLLVPDRDALPPPPGDLRVLPLEPGHDLLVVPLLG